MSEGKVWKYGDDINTDIIFPGKYTYTISAPEEMAEHALEDLDPDFVKNVSVGDYIVAGKNFGCGSSREQAAVCLKYAGIRAVIGESFARIFFRNAINLGLPVIQCKEAVEKLEKDDLIEIDFENGIIKSHKGNFMFPPLPDAVIGIVNSGGLIEYTQKRLGISK